MGHKAMIMHVSFPPTILSMVLVILMGLWCSSNARTFVVGGEDGWRLHSPEKFTQWAEKHRFEIKDELVFKYEKGHNSALVVNRNDYTKCNKENPINTLKNGHSRFKLEKSGPFFFISGHDQNCEKGQKLEIIVLSKNHHHNNSNNNATAPSPSPQTSITPPAVKPPYHSPSPSSPPVEPPSHSQSPPPAGKIPTHVPPVQPPSQSPSPSPTAGKSPTWTSSVEPPSSHSRSSAPAAENPTHVPPVEPPSHSASPPPAARTPIQPPTHSPSPGAESPKNSYVAPQPDTDHHHQAQPPEAHLRVLPPHRGPLPLKFRLRPMFPFVY